MEHNSLQAWFTDRAMEHTTVEQLAALMPDYGISAGEQVVLENMKERFDDEVATATSADEYIEAFNRITSDWPHRPRPVLAAYILDSDEEYPDDFEQQARDFAEAEEVLDREMQATLDVYYAGNPFADHNLTDEEARTITVARMLGFDDTEVPLDEIEDHDDFVWWLREDQNIEKALRLHYFGRDLPEGVFEYALPPDEWEIPTDDLAQETCIDCGTTHTRIHHHADGVAYTTENGATAGIDDIAESDEYFIDSAPTNRNLVCDQCWPDFNNGNATQAAIVTNRGAIRIESSQNIIHDVGYDNDDLVSFASLSDEMQENVIDIATTDGANGNWHILVAGDGPIPDSHATDRIDSALSSPTELDPLDDSSGPVGIISQSVFDGRRRAVMGQSDDWPACRYAKELLDGTRGVVA